MAALAAPCHIPLSVTPIHTMSNPIKSGAVNRLTIHRRRRRIVNTMSNPIKSSAVDYSLLGPYLKKMFRSGSSHLPPSFNP